MLYCAIDEAFNNNNSLKKDAYEYQINKFNNKRGNCEGRMDEPHTFDNYTELDLPVVNSEPNPVYFTAQGGLKDSKRKLKDSESKTDEERFGTSLVDLKENNLKDEDIPSFLDSQDSDNSFLQTLTPNIKKKKRISSIIMIILIFF